MKKLLIAFMAILFINSAVLAQAQKQAPTKATTTKTVATKPVVSNGVVLKKDGTADKRYSKSAKVVPLKKDGTPDKRYKANKKI